MEGTGNGGEVLIVDDEPGVREPAREMCALAGYGVTVAGDGEEAVRLLEERPFDVAVVDIMLPDADGLELTEEIIGRFGVNVIVITGFSDRYSYEHAIDKGASDFIVKPVRLEELLLRIKRVLRERRLTREREELLQEMRRLAVTDGLTKLFNSRHFYQQIEVETGRARRYCRPLSLLLFDLDKFKNYNDTYGHLEGDKVLSAIARISRDCLRKMDSAFRYGGEEFTVILPETSGQEAMHVAERLREKVALHVFEPEPGTEVHLTVSVGVTEYAPGETARDLVRRVDAAMYVSKRKGGNAVSGLTKEAFV